MNSNILWYVFQMRIEKAFTNQSHSSFQKISSFFGNTIFFSTPRSSYCNNITTIRTKSMEQKSTWFQMHPGFEQRQNIHFVSRLHFNSNMKLLFDILKFCRIVICHSYYRRSFAKDNFTNKEDNWVRNSIFIILMAQFEKRLCFSSILVCGNQVLFKGQHWFFHIYFVFMCSLVCLCGRTRDYFLTFNGDEAFITASFRFEYETKNKNILFFRTDL